MVNVCEHGDHHAPDGQRYCSLECQECDSVGGRLCGPCRDEEYECFEPFTADRDVEVRLQRVKVVTCRGNHACANPYAPHIILAGYRARYECALVDGAWGQYWTCLVCLDRMMEETDG